MRLGMGNLGESLFMLGRLTFTDSYGFFVNVCIDCTGSVAVKFQVNSLRRNSSFVV